MLGRGYTGWGVAGVCVGMALVGAVPGCGGGGSGSKPVPKVDAGEAGPDSGSDAGVCPGGQSLCDGTCVDIQVDPANCGVCGTACAAGQVCSGGSCTATCGGRLTKCGRDGGGYCANLSSDNANCGACGAQCGAGEACSGGKCTLTCGSGRTMCSREAGVRYCANLSTDNGNCGACGSSCGAGQVCSGGQCALTCGSGLTLCGPADAGADAGSDAGADAGSDAGGAHGAAPYCANFSTDNANCGACGNVCGAGKVCSGGKCAVTCAAALDVCNGICVDEQTDGNNCGSCDNKCTGVSHCVGGSCCTPTTWYMDADGDGYGDPANPVMACTKPAHMVADNTDCDDTNPAVYPGAPELCDGLQDDCSATSWTSDAGLASFQAADGTWTDETATLAAGTASSPVTMTLAADGKLDLCAGTWYAGFEVKGNVDIVGIGGRDAVVIDGGNSQRIVHSNSAVDIGVTGVTAAHGNESSGNGGALYFGGNVKNVTLDDVHVTDSTASGAGGCVMSGSNDLLTLTNVALSGCQAGTFGGGLDTTNTTQVDISGLRLVGNDASKADGGGWYDSGSSAAVKGLGVVGNTADFGGGVYSYAADISVEDSVLTNNSATGDGGGWYQWKGTTTFQQVTFANNSCPIDGAFHLQEADATFDTCSFGGNTAQNYGGAIGVFASSTLTVTASDFSGNLPNDVYAGSAYTYGTGASFTCTSSSCQ